MAAAKLKTDELLVLTLRALYRLETYEYLNWQRKTMMDPDRVRTAPAYVQSTAQTVNALQGSRAADEAAFQAGTA